MKIQSAFPEIQFLNTELNNGAAAIIRRIPADSLRVKRHLMVTFKRQLKAPYGGCSSAILEGSNYYSRQLRWEEG
jgi:hypothetical protein